jgi:hypothetical protein
LNAAKKIILLLWLLIVASLGNVSALTPGASENRVWQKSFETLETRLGEPLQTLGRHQENEGARYDYAVDSLLAADSAATETFYRTMSQGDYQQFLSTGQIPATGETFISPSLEYAQQYNGVTVQFNVQAGTQDALMGMGVRNSAGGFTGTAFEGLPTVSGGWTDSSAFFKWEGGTVNIGLGNGSALNTFNNNIVSFGLVPKP